MHLLNNYKYRSLSLFIIILLGVTTAFSQQNGSIRGAITNELTQVIVGATVKVIDADGKEKTATTDSSGNFVVNGLKPGIYTIVVEAKGFSVASDTVEVVAGKAQEVTIALSVEIQQEEVNVNPDAQLSTSQEDNKSALVLKPEDLEGLPDDPDELAQALLALAGGAAGPNGGQIYIDGFTGGRMPPKEAIREIRINQNPFSAEYDRLGFGRIEILTRPGFDRFRGSANFMFNDESLNSRNPYANTRAPHQQRNYGFNFGGPIKKGKSSFFLDFNRREGDDNSLVNAIVLDSALNPLSFNQTVLVPTRSLSFSPRFDYAINTNNTLVGRYSYSKRTTDNRGVGNYSLPSLAFETGGTNQSIQLTETAILTGSIVNETRFQFNSSRDTRTGDNTIPTLSVSEAFTTGGAQVGNSYTNTKEFEISNITTWIFKSHTFKFGSRLEGVSITDHSESNFGGTVSFFGSTGLTSLEQYKQRLLGSTQARFLPSQFSITIGNPDSSVKQYEFGGFFTDDWRARQNLTLSFGLRYENQNNIESNINFAPRFSFAWSPGGGGNRQPKMVLRGGAGIFYNRIGENTSLQTIRFDGQRQIQYIIRNNPIVEDTAANNLLRQIQFAPSGAVTNIPTAAQLGAFTGTTSVIRQIAGTAQAPYTMQTAFSVERQLPRNTTVTATYIWARSLHLLRQRNVNSPIIIGYDAVLNRPILQAVGSPLYQYETSGKNNQNTLSVNVNTRFSPKFSIFANYTLSKISSDVDGSSFPEYTYDLSNEYGRSSFDSRHRFNLFGNITLPWQISFNPFMIISSGRPFNIITGLDTNGDLQINERPTFATDLTRPSVRVTPFGTFDLNPLPGQTTIPRNYGQGPGSVTVNLRMSKTFGFGSLPGRNASAQQQGGQGGDGNRGGGAGGGGGRGGGGGNVVFAGGGGGGRGGGGGFGGGGNEKRFNLTFSVSVNNLLNTNNQGNPVGNLSSPFFGISNNGGGGFGGGGFGGGGVFFGGGGGGGGNRRVDLSLRFSF